MTNLRIEPRPQRFDALARANEVRLAMAGIRRELRVGVTDVVDAIHDKRAESMTVFTLLMCLPGYGPRRVRGVLARADSLAPIGERRRCSELTLRQKALIAAEVMR